jgi:hypothetical protein
MSDNPRRSPRTRFKEGDSVMINSGPFVNTQGIVIRVVPGFLWVMAVSGHLFKLDPAIATRCNDEDAPVHVVFI